MCKSNPDNCCEPAQSCCDMLGKLLEPRFFKALGDGNRIALLARLAAIYRPCTVSEIACCCPVDLSVVSRHLGILRDANIVEANRKGKEVHYTVRYDILAETFRNIADAIDACCVDQNETSQLQSAHD